MRSLIRKFDRLIMYRIAAFLLAVPTLYILVTDRNFVGSTSELVVRVIYRTGLGLLLVTVAMDWWEVYTGKRRVKNMIRKRTEDNG